MHHFYSGGLHNVYSCSLGAAQCLILSISLCGGDCPQAARNTPNDNDHVSASFSIQMQLTKFASKLYNTDHTAQACAE